MDAQDGAFVEEFLEEFVAELVEALIRAVVVKLEKEREKTRRIRESLVDDLDELIAKGREQLSLLKDKDQKLAEEKPKEKLVADFLEAVDNNKNFDDKAMMSAVEAFISPEDVSRINLDELMIGFETGVGINHLENTQNPDKDEAEEPTTEGKKDDEE